MWDQNTPLPPAAGAAGEGPTNGDAPSGCASIESDHDVPVDCVAVGTATFRSDAAGNRVDDGHITHIVYAKAQICDTAPNAMRMFAASNPPFPDYSTGDQYLSETEFDQLVALGEHLAMRIEAIRSAPIVTDGESS